MAHHRASRARLRVQAGRLNRRHQVERAKTLANAVLLVGRKGAGELTDRKHDGRVGDIAE